jgi:hypothetical protein
MVDSAPAPWAKPIRRIAETVPARIRIALDACFVLVGPILPESGALHQHFTTCGYQMWPDLAAKTRRPPHETGETHKCFVYFHYLTPILTVFLNYGKTAHVFPNLGHERGVYSSQADAMATDQRPEAKKTSQR